MSNWSIAAATLLTLIGLLHSVLGERYLLGPLLRDMPRGPLSPLFAKRTLRAAWHIMSVALWGLAAVLVRPESAFDVVAVNLLVSAALLGAWTRGAHFAWPLFAATGVMSALAAHDGALVEVVRGPVAITLAAALGGIAALHVYWAAGGRWALDGAIPTELGTPRFIPGRLLTLGVAGVFAGLAVCALAVADVVAISAPGSRAILTLAGGAFVLRAFGEGRYVGFFKRKVGTRFARRDTAIYTPLCVLLGAASFAVVL